MNIAANGQHCRQFGNLLLCPVMLLIKGTNFSYDYKTEPATKSVAKSQAISIRSSR